jgi:hypothetical protein
MHADFLGLAARPPLPPGILEIAHQFLLLRVHRDRRLPLTLERHHLFVDVSKLLVAVRVGCAFSCFAIGLQTELLFLQFLRHRPRPNLETLLPQLGRQVGGALARPPQRLLRVASRRRFNQRRQGPGESGLFVPHALAPAAGSANPIIRHRRIARRFGFQLFEALAQRGRRHTRRRHYSSHAAPAHGPRLCRSPKPPGPLIERPPQRLVLIPDPLHNSFVWHTQYIGMPMQISLLYSCAMPYAADA